MRLDDVYFIGRDPKVGCIMISADQLSRMTEKRLRRIVWRGFAVGERIIDFHLFSDSETVLHVFMGTRSKK